jgi:transposase
MVEAIFYVLRTAVAWRDLPPCYGPWNSVYTRWRRWCALGLWQKILQLLSRHSVGRVRFVDGSHIKLHQFGTNPAGGQSAQAIGRTKGGLNTKLCALVEGEGRLVAALVAPGQIYEVEAAAPLLQC